MSARLRCPASNSRNLRRLLFAMRSEFITKLRLCTTQCEQPASSPSRVSLGLSLSLSRGKEGGRLCQPASTSSSRDDSVSQHEGVGGASTTTWKEGTGWSSSSRDVPACVYPPPATTPHTATHTVNEHCLLSFCHHHLSSRRPSQLVAAPRRLRDSHCCFLFRSLFRGAGRGRRWGSRRRPRASRRRRRSTRRERPPRGPRAGSEGTTCHPIRKHYHIIIIRASLEPVRKERRVTPYGSIIPSSSSSSSHLVSSPHSPLMREAERSKLEQPNQPTNGLLCQAREPRALPRRLRARPGPSVRLRFLCCCFLFVFGCLFVVIVFVVVVIVFRGAAARPHNQCRGRRLPQRRRRRR